MDNIQPQHSKEDLLVTQMPSLKGIDPETKRQEILDYFHKTFTLDEKLYECLKDEKSFLSKGSPLRHPLIFYYGHTAVFFINKLFVAGLIPERVDAEKESTFAIGVDEMSWDDLNDINYNWPTIAEVKQYRDKVRKVVSDLIETMPLILPIQWNDPFWIINMGIEHERIHIETSSVLIRELPIEKVESVDLFSVCPTSKAAPENSLVDVAGAKVKLGKPDDDDFYGWDNEYGIKNQDVKSFKASKFLVSNQEYFEFMQDGGYQTQKYWSVEGWKWKQFAKLDCPHFWVKSEGNYKYRTLTEEIDMPWDWPVDINFLEAKAFCEWKSEKINTKVRMPSEAEWMVMREKLDTDQPLWDKAPGNINLEYWASACPVNYLEASKKEPHNLQRLNLDINYTQQKKKVLQQKHSLGDEGVFL